MNRIERKLSAPAVGRAPAGWLRRARGRALPALGALALAGCASTQVRTDFDQRVSFGGLHAYAWVERKADGEGHPTLQSPLLEPHVRGAVDRELARLGYRLAVAGEEPDFRVGYRVQTKDDAGPGYGHGSGYGHGHLGHGFGHGAHRGFGHGGHGGYGGYGSGHERVRGTLVLDVFDGRSGALIWRGWAQRSFLPNPKPKAVRDYVKDAAVRILADFPASEPRQKEPRVAAAPS